MRYAWGNRDALSSTGRSSARCGCAGGVLSWCDPAARRSAPVRPMSRDRRAGTADRTKSDDRGRTRSPRARSMGTIHGGSRGGNAPAGLPQPNRCVRHRSACCPGRGWVDRPRRDRTRWWRKDADSAWYPLRRAKTGAPARAAGCVRRDLDRNSGHPCRAGMWYSRITH